MLNNLPKAVRSLYRTLKLFPGSTMNKRPTATQRQPNRSRIKNHHYLLGGTVIVIGSWITHTTTATVYDEFNNQQALEFAKAMPNNGYALNGGLPNEFFNEPLRVAHGPFSSDSELAQSPSDHIFDEDSNSDSAGSARNNYAETAYTIRRGDTLGSIFKKLDLDLSLPYHISQHDTAKQLVSLSVGRDLLLRKDTEENLRELSYPISALQNLVVTVDGNSVDGAEVQDVAYITTQQSISGEISSSLYEAALDAGLSISMVMDMVRIFGWDIDFVLDIRQGDTFHVIYDRYERNGEVLADGNILAAEFTTQNETYRAVRFDDGEGNASYYTPEGESMLGTFLRSPVEFSRISSRFGKRKHPILKTWRAHKGVDYAAARGTPIRATADGKVIHAGKKGGYGKTVILRHAGRFSTLYGHMNGYAKGVRTGSRVKQGDVIGYIGSTGLATGPHLHYEFRLDGVHRNPLTFKTPKAGSVSAESRPEFDQLSLQWMARLDTLVGAYQLAKQNRAKGNSAEAF